MGITIYKAFEYIHQGEFNLNGKKKVPCWCFSWTEKMREKSSQDAKIAQRKRKKEKYIR